MNATITLPTGSKVRTGSKRRYVLVRQVGAYHPVILKRSDNVMTLRRFARGTEGTYVKGPLPNRLFLWDTVAGTVVPV